MTSQPSPHPAFLGEAVPYVFIDVETSTLKPWTGELLEVSWVLQRLDGTVVERSMHPEHTLQGAEPEALEVNGYWDRIHHQPRVPLRDCIEQLAEDAAGAVLAGANVGFDRGYLEYHAHLVGIEPTWQHRPFCVEGQVASLLGRPGRKLPSLRQCADLLGIEYDPSKAHGALYDAQLARRVHDTAWALGTSGASTAA